jgi:hypothetical protein
MTPTTSGVQSVQTASAYCGKTMAGLMWILLALLSDVDGRKYSWARTLAPVGRLHYC